MAWTTPKTWAVGEQATAADMNTYISGNMHFLGHPPYLLAYASGPTPQLVPAGANTWFAVVFGFIDTQSGDSTIAYNVSTGVATVPVAGAYACAASISLHGTPSGGNMETTFYKNGAQYGAGQTVTGQTGQATAIAVATSDVIQCAATDTITTFCITTFTSANGVGIWPSSNVDSGAPFSRYPYISYMTILKVSN